MDNFFKSHLVFTFLFGGVSFGLWYFIYSTYATELTIIHTIYATDLSDNRRLVGASSHIFIARIVAPLETVQDIGGLPVSRFEVEILDNIKGNLSGRATVSQEGGYQEGILYLADGDVDFSENIDELPSKFDIKNILLQEGEIYLLSTIYNEEKDEYHLIPHVNAKKHFCPKMYEKMGINGILFDEKIKQFKKAYTEEIPFELFVKEGRNSNAYSQLSPEEQKKIFHS